MSNNQDESGDLSLIKLETKVEEKKTTHSPFYKRGEKCVESQNEHEDSFEESAIRNKKGVVIFQSNIDFTVSSGNSRSREKSNFDLSPS